MRMNDAQQSPWAARIFPATPAGGLFLFLSKKRLEIRIIVFH